MLHDRSARPTALLWCMSALVIGAAARLAALSELAATVDKAAHDEKETILARDSRLPPDSQQVTQPSATQGVPALLQLLSVLCQPCRTGPLLSSFMHEKNHLEVKHHRRVKRFKETNTSLLHSNKQAQLSANEPSPSTGSSSLWLHPSQNRSLVSVGKVTDNRLLSMRPKKGQDRTWNHSPTRRIVTLRPGWFLINPWNPNSLRSVFRHALASFLEESSAANDFSQNSPQDQNFEWVSNQQSTQSSAPPQDFQGFPKKQRQQMYATGRNQRSTDTSVIQRLLSLIQTYGKDDELMESSFFRTGSIETFPQPSPSNFDIHSEAHTQTQEQEPFEIPSNLLNVLDLYYDANLHDSGNIDESISGALAPAPSLEVPPYPNSQPFIPAYHQVFPPSPPNVVQDSLAPASQSPSFSSISLISSVVSNPTSCFEDTLCTIGIAFVLAVGASTLILLPFSQGRRRRSLDDKAHNSEDMMEPLVSRLLQLEQCLFVPTFSRPSPKDDPQRASHQKTKRLPIMCITNSGKIFFSSYYMNSLRETQYEPKQHGY
ncbi:uncharacterized protein LOC135094414 [Scylla paramamosain]|uniref:uncharacterized protein LOC135094414 n=1 Tax=Scylla paramamosain TaxID=85552 RepID=UPI003083CC5D